MPEQGTTPQDAMSGAEVYRKYLQNTLASEQLQEAIMRGVREGEDPAKLLLMAVQAIGRMTGSDLIYQVVRRNLLAVYGEALEQEAPLEIMIQDAEGRLQKILAAEAATEDPEMKEALHQAVTSHQALIRRLQEKKDKH
ncbi:MAG: hypothetical protein IJ083_13690 [Clostridia bacterium]|nr:hypothetical protein [Clostridia bacterium]